MPKSKIKIAILVVAFLILSFAMIGLLKEVSDLKRANQELSSQIEELERIIKEQSEEIEINKKVYELRNILDIESRKIITALNDGDFSNIDFLNENVTVLDDRLVFEFDNYTNEALYLNGSVDYKRLRQRFYLRDDNGKFITGYEVENIFDDDLRRVLHLTFIEEDANWKLYNIESDR